MISKKTMQHFFPALLIALLSAGSVVVWASPPDGHDNIEEAAGEADWPDPDEVAVSASLSVSTRQSAGQGATMDPTLVGTAVVEGGASFAVFQLPGGTRFVREGGEIAGGLHLVQVLRNRVDVERNGVRDEIFMDWDQEGSMPQDRPTLARAAIQGGAESPWGSHRDKVEYRREMMARHRGQQLQ